MRMLEQRIENLRGMRGHDSGIEKLDLFEVGRVIVDEERILRPKPGAFQHVCDGLPLGAEGDMREDEVLPNPKLDERGLRLFVTVLRADGVHDAAVGKLFHHLHIARDRSHAAFEQCAGPEGVVQIPDDQLHLVDNHGSSFKRARGQKRI
jgi:hypothetical protein